MKYTLNHIFITLLTSIFLFSCTDEKTKFIDENVDFAAKQTLLMLKNVGEPTGHNYPRTMNDEGELVTTEMKDWTPGFFQVLFGIYMNLQVIAFG